MGEIAGILSAVTWAISATLFSEGSRLFGAEIVNRFRLLMGLILFMIVNTIIDGSPLPFGADGKYWLYFGISGILGLAIGDGLMYTAYNLIGTRLAMLVTVFNPVLSALMAWLLLDEVLPPLAFVGVGLTVLGVGMVVLERKEIGSPGSKRKSLALGFLCSGVAVLMYSFGNIFSKMGLMDGFSAFSGVSMRMVFACIFSWAPVLFARKRGGVLQKFRDNPKITRLVLIGSVIGPFGGVWLSFVALQNAQVGIASTLTCTAPIFILPISKWIYKEELSWRAWAGTLVALAGVAVIFLVR
jgi:drug/metabolite transporter (DMT)-like permease